jgi:phospholipase A1
MKKIVILVCLVAYSLFGAEFKNEENIDYTKIDDPQTKEWIDSWLDGNFGLKPHKVNYILPISYRLGNDRYKDFTQPLPYNNTEAELQVSLKLGVGGNLFGLNEEYYLAYSHKAFWQVYTDSSPFRETNYAPEAFVVFPIQDTNSLFQLRNIKLGLGHISNGQAETHGAQYEYHYQDPANQSRSLNFIYTELTLQHNAIITSWKFWYRIPENIEVDDNPDYTDYTGNAEVNFNYFYQKNKFSLMGRYNISTNYGAVEASYSYPLLKDVYFFTKVFHGYAESLIDYNTELTKVAVGFSFSR